MTSKEKILGEAEQEENSKAKGKVEYPKAKHQIYFPSETSTEDDKVRR